GMRAGQRESQVAPTVEVHRGPAVRVVAVPFILRAGRGPDLALGVAKLIDDAAPGTIALHPDSQGRGLAGNRDRLLRLDGAIADGERPVAGLDGQRHRCSIHVSIFALTKLD